MPAQEEVPTAIYVSSDEGESDEEEDSESYKGAPLTVHEETTLDSAIDEAEEGRLRLILKALVRIEPEAKTLIGQSLTIPLVGSVSKKRKRFDVCGNCGAEYMTTENSIGSCAFFHPGELDVDLEHEGFAVLQDSRTDPTDVPDERETPEAFIWLCCYKHGDEGCVES